MVDFICMGLLEQQGTQSKREIQKNLVHGGIRTRYLPLSKQTRYRLRHEIWCPQSVRSYSTFICVIYLYHVLDMEKCFVVYYILLTLYSKQTSILVKLQNDTNVISLQYRTKYFFYVYHVVQVNSTDKTRLYLTYCGYQISMRNSASAS